MNTEERRIAKAEWERQRRARLRATRMEVLATIRCPHCTILLDSPYHQPNQQLQTFGKVCAYWKPTLHIEFIQVLVHADNDNPQQNRLDGVNG